MALAFPNASRSFDSSKNGVRFVGHDGMFEVPFMVQAAALARTIAKSGKKAVSEDECLAAFDTSKSSIHNVAREAYANTRRTSYTLTAADFR